MSDFDPVLAGHSNAESAVSGFSSSQSAAGQDITAGVLLRSAREAAGLHIAALAVSLKVPVKKLEALEQDRFDLLPDVVFARALASSVCRTLKLDVAQVLERLPQTSAPKLISQGAGINTPFRSPADGPGPSIWAQISSRPAVLAGLALLLGALVLIFLPTINQEAVPGKPDAGAAQANVEPFQSLPAAVVMAGAGLVDSAKLAVSTQQADESVAAASATATVGLPSTESLTSAASVPAQVSVSVPAPAPAPTLANSTAALSGTATPANPALPAVPTGIVTFRAKGESWVEVIDAKGTVVLRRTLAAGEVAGASGILPLAAVVGRADATQVQVRGQAFDLTAVARNNVARFEVK